MYRDFTYDGVLAASTRAAWQIEDVVPADARFDFARPFLPEALARTIDAPGLDDRERLLLNQIRAHDYLSLFGLIEEFILPFVLDHARPQLSGDDARVRALLNFASEEAKHIALFKGVHGLFVAGFGHSCRVIGPAQAIADNILAHDPLSVALMVLHVEWMTQSHYVDSVRDNASLDPLFKNLLRCHWIEEAQHAKLDTMMVESLAASRPGDAILDALPGYLEIVRLLDAGLKEQAGFNLDALERARGSLFEDAVRDRLIAQQHQALRWTYLGSGMRHGTFRSIVGGLSPAALAILDGIAPSYC